MCRYILWLSNPAQAAACGGDVIPERIIKLLIEFAGILASAVTFIMFIPTAAGVWRHRNTPSSLAGVSASTAWMMVIGSTSWIVYGLGTGAFWIAAPSLVNLPLGVFILFLLGRARGMSAEVEVALVSVFDGEALKGETVKSA